MSETRKLSCSTCGITIEGMPGCMTYKESEQFVRDFIELHFHPEPVTAASVGGDV